MNHIITLLSAQDIGLALQAGGLHTYVKEINLYGIQNGGDDYEVYTGQLLDIYPEACIAMDLFEFQEHAWVLAAAINRVNSQYTPVRVAAGFDMISLTLCVEPASIESFSKLLPQWLARIEQAVDQLGQACDLVLLEAAQDDLAEVSNQLSNPTPTAPGCRDRKRPNTSRICSRTFV